MTISFYTLTLVLVLVNFLNVISLKIHCQVDSTSGRLSNHPAQMTSKDSLAHRYYNLQQTRRVSASRSIQYLNQCKDLCLSMHELFPFEFKYHRLVYRQVQGDMKYITGECLYAFKVEQKNPNIPDEQQKEQNKKAYLDEKKQKSSQKQRKWFGWKNLKSFLDLAVVEDTALKQQKKAWQAYLKDCEDDSLKLSESSRIDFKLTLVHSDFQYYENQGFENLKPFDDIDALFGALGV